MLKIGVLGGTFDPVHLGHLGMADAARDTLNLDKVLMIPAGQPMTRLDRPVTSTEHRLNMLRTAIEDYHGLEVSTIETERPGPSYTVDTLRALRNEYGTNGELYFILGWDSLAQLPEWRDPAGLIELCRLVAIPRPGYPEPDLMNLERDIPGIREKVILLEQPKIDISATVIKETIAAGKSMDHLVPAAVAEYIRKHKLYLGGKR